jgi:hypothetical protein
LANDPKKNIEALGNDMVRNNAIKLVENFFRNIETAKELEDKFKEHGIKSPETMSSINAKFKDIHLKSIELNNLKTIFSNIKNIEEKKVQADKSTEEKNKLREENKAQKDKSTEENNKLREENKAQDKVIAKLIEENNKLKLIEDKSTNNLNPIKKKDIVDYSQMDEIFNNAEKNKETVIPNRKKKEIKRNGSNLTE